MNGIQVTAMSIMFIVWTLSLVVTIWAVRYNQQHTSMRDAVLEAIRRGDLQPMSFCFKLDNSHIEYDGTNFVEERCDCWRRTISDDDYPPLP